MRRAVMIVLLIAALGAIGLGLYLRKDADHPDTKYFVDPDTTSLA